MPWIGPKTGAGFDQNQVRVSMLGMEIKLLKLTLISPVRFWRYVAEKNQGHSDHLAGLRLV